MVNDKVREVLVDQAVSLGIELLEVAGKSLLKTADELKQKHASKKLEAVPEAKTIVSA